MIHGVRRYLVSILICMLGLALLVEACSFAISFRAYLYPDFFQPFRRDIGSLAKGLPAEKNNYLPYAGIEANPDGSPISGLREAYRTLLNSPTQPGQFGQLLPLAFSPEAIDVVRNHIRNMPPVAPAQGHEVELLRCKLDLRSAEVKDDASLVAAQTCLQTYLQQNRPAALRSEARGWLARTHYLRKQHTDAARIYLDELESADSNIKRQRLLNSLAMLYRWTPLQIEDLNALLDTPSHALYASNLATNRSRRIGGDTLSKNLLAGLEQRKELFRQGPQSDALALAQMRASLMVGDPDAILRFGSMISSTSSLRKDSEYVWLTGNAHYLKANYREAERWFLELLELPETSATDRSRGGTALQGVYDRMGRPVDQLNAAFRVGDRGREVWNEFQERGVDPGPFDGAFSFDAAFLLDAQLTDREIQQYIQRFGGARPTVDYVRAVRHARKEEFEEAARIYAALSASEREAQAKEAARLFAATRRPGTEEARLQALYDYADFLASNPNRIFFNDRLWGGFQRGAFISLREDSAIPPMTPDKLARVRQLERKLRDEQEEYWRAYQILNGIVLKAGPTPLGKQAARRAIVCLRRIITDRFGRLSEIQAADRRLSSWLLRNETPAAQR